MARERREKKKRQRKAADTVAKRRSERRPMSPVSVWVVLVILAVAGFSPLEGGGKTASSLDLKFGLLSEPPAAGSPATTSQEFHSAASLDSGKILDSRTFPIGGEEKITVMFVPAENFTMGSQVSEHGRSGDESKHQVTLSSHYWMGNAEVLQAQWVAVMGNPPSNFKG